MHMTWFCHHTEPFEIRKDGRFVAFINEWLICEVCDILLHSGNKKALILRAAEAHPERQPGNLRAMYGLMEALLAEFQHGWLDSHPLHERRECLINLPGVQ
jgi:hypothetical protein